MSTSAKRRGRTSTGGGRKSARKSARRERTTIAGILAVFLVLVGVLVWLVGWQDAKPKRLPLSDITPITAALLHVPTTDVPGFDPDGLPRPTGSVRAFWRHTNNLSTVMYNRKEGYQEVVAQIQHDLPAAGWMPPVGQKAGQAPTQSKSWTYVYARGQEVVQVAVIGIGAVTSTTYIVQSKP